MGRDESRTYPLRINEIRRLMDNQNISVAELARRTRISHKQIKNVLDGVTKKSRQDTITRIAAALGVRWRTIVEDYDGPVEKADEGGGVAVQTTVDLFIETSDDLPPEEVQRRLQAAMRKAGSERIKSADIIRIIKLRPKNEI